MHLRVWGLSSSLLFYPAVHQQEGCSYEHGPAPDFFQFFLKFFLPLLLVCGASLWVLLWNRAQLETGGAVLIPCAEKRTRDKWGCGWLCTSVRCNVFFYFCFFCCDLISHYWAGIIYWSRTSSLTLNVKYIHVWAADSCSLMLSTRNASWCDC